VPSCAEGGVLGVLPGIVGSLQALEVLKLILGVGEPLIGRLQLFDGLKFRWRELRIRKNPDCPVCGEHRTIHQFIDYEEFCGVRQQQLSDAQTEKTVPQITPAELKNRLDQGDSVTIIDVREPHEWDIASLENYGATLIPLGELTDRLSEINLTGDVIVHCKSGARSARATQQLRAAGLERVWNLKGGILAWSDQVDPSVPRY
jgi:adenylyltransferase/sulfurtransferase